MALVPLVDIESLEGHPREVAESGRAQYGTVLNTWAAIMNKPDLFAAYLPFLRQVAGPGELDAITKDLSALLVASLNNCRYSVSHRATSAKKNGASEAQLREVVAGNWSGFDARLRTALELTRELTLLPPQEAYSQMPYGVHPELRERAKAAFSEVELLELTFSISVWNALSRFHRVMGFELDMPAPPEGLEPA